MSLALGKETRHKES